MEEATELSGNESDVTVVLEYTSEDRDEELGNHTQSDVVDNETGPTEATLDNFSSERAVSDEVNSDSDVSLDFGSDSDASRAGRVMEIHSGLRTAPKVAYSSIGFFNTLGEAEKALHVFNRFVYTYRTRYLSPFVLGKVYQCRSHIGCGHRLKLSTHRADETSFRYQLLQRGRHVGPNVQIPQRGISSVLKPEIDALLKLEMSAGRVRNMIMFKYIHEPEMMSHVPEVRKMENRKAYLKKKATGGWEITKFIALTNWTSLKLCQDPTTFHSVDENNFADMNALIVLHDFEHTVVVGGQQVASMGMIVTTRALFKNVRQAVQDQGSSLVLSTDGTYRIHFGGWTLVDFGGISVESTDAGFVQRFRPWLYMFVRTESAPAYEQLFRTLIKYAKDFYDIDVSVHSASIDHADGIASALVSVWP